MELAIFNTLDELSVRAADLFVKAAEKEVSEKGYFTAVLSGGSTPKALYHKLSSNAFIDNIPWDRTHLFWGDERCVRPDDPASNFKLAESSLISRLDIPAENIHRVRAELPPFEAAGLYEQEIKGFFGAKGVMGIPSFDLMLLGLGADGHTLSIFPSSDVLKETSRLVVADFPAAIGAWRITMTLPLANSSKRCVFLVSGAKKAEALKKTLSRDEGVPASLIKPKGELVFLADKEAARLV